MSMVPKMFKQFIVPFSLLVTPSEVLSKIRFQQDGQPHIGTETAAIFPGGWIVRDSNSVSQPAHVQTSVPMIF